MKVESGGGFGREFQMVGPAMVQNPCTPSAVDGPGGGQKVRQT